MMRNSDQNLRSLKPQRPAKSAENQMAAYIAVVSLMQDMEQLLFSNGTRFYWERNLYPFTKKQIEILYRTVCMMDSFLRDPSGESYNHEIMNPELEKTIRDVAQKAGAYVDVRTVRSLPGPKPRITMTRMIKEAPSLTEMTEEIISINGELKKMHDGRNVQDFDVASSTGKSTFSSPSRNPKYRGQTGGS